MQDVMVMGLASMAPVSKLRMAATFAIVRMDGMVQSAMYQVLLGGSQSCVTCDSMTSTASFLLESLLSAGPLTLTWSICSHSRMPFRAKP